MLHWLVVFVVGTLAVAMIIGITKQSGEQREAFMAECVQYHKQFECTAMWRAGNTQPSTAMPVIIHSGR